MATYLKRVLERSACTQENGKPCYFYGSVTCTKPEWLSCYCDYAGTCFRLATKREIEAWKRRQS